MNFRKFLLILVLILVLSASLYLGYKFYTDKSNEAESPETNLTTQPVQQEGPQVVINNTTINVELADTPDKRSLGLSGRSSLDPNSGMLFTFDSQDSYPVFWMKDMQIPLDIIWINDGKIVKIHDSVPVPAPGTSDMELEKYRPSTAIDFVLEVNAGFARRNNISEGDMVTLPI